MADKIHLINLNFGYVESSHAASILLLHHTGFNSSVEACSSLATSLLRKYLQGVNVVINKCCKDNPDKYLYCPTCGRNLEKAAFSPLDNEYGDGSLFGDWLNDWWSLSTNDMGFEEHLFDGWWPWNDLKEIMEKYTASNLLTVMISERTLPVFVDPKAFPGFKGNISKLQKDYLASHSRYDEDVKAWDDILFKINATKRIG